MAALHLTCGKIACGKTYYAEKLCVNSSAVLFSVDDLMLTMYDKCLGDNHVKTEQRCMKYLLKLAIQTVKCGTDAVLDFGFWNYDVRKTVSDYCTEHGIEFTWHYFDLDYFARKERLKKRNAELKKSPHREYIIDDEMLKRFDGWFDYPMENERMVNENGYNSQI